MSAKFKGSYPIKVAARQDAAGIYCAECPRCQNFIPNVEKHMEKDSEIECEVCKYKFRVFGNLRRGLQN